MSKLSRTKKRAVAALLATPKVDDAAKVAGVGERTLYRWLSEDQDFQAALASAEGVAIDTAARALVQIAGDAIDTLRGLLENEETTDSVRLRAAQSVLEHLLRLREAKNIEQRLARLEALADGQS